ncbi:alpha/beta family hydrolase [Rhodovibrionaceae bacterium A322]
MTNSKQTADSPPVLVTSDGFLIDGPQEAPLTFAFAHGAGAPMDTPFMAAFATALAEEGIRVVRFEFPYMARMRREGGRRPPNRAPVLMETWRQVAELLSDAPKLAVGGKSMGGRFASLFAAQRENQGAPLAAVACLGYPFHPPGKPENLRVEHLSGLKTPTLVVQGTRDPFGTEAEVPNYPLSDAISLSWAPDGDHNLTPRKASGQTQEQNWQEAGAALATFLKARI